MDKVLSIDPSGTGTSGICLVENGICSFTEYQNKNWKEHLTFIISLIKEKQPNLIIYENTNYINLKGIGMTSLFKLFGAIECLSSFFNLAINNILVKQVKELKDNLLKGNKNIMGLTYQVGRGKGWKWNETKISIHQLDALIVYWLWSKKY